MKQRFLNSSWVGKSDNIQVFIVRNFLLYEPSIQKNSIIFFTICKYFTHCIQYFILKFRLARLCQVLADPVTIIDVTTLLLYTNWIVIMWRARWHLGKVRNVKYGWDMYAPTCKAGEDNSFSTFKTKNKIWDERIWQRIRPLTAKFKDE